MNASWLKNIYNKYRYFIPPGLLYHSAFFSTVQHLSLDANSHSSRIVDERLRAILLLCMSKVPFYINNVNVKIEDIKHNQPHLILKEFPFLTKSDVISNADQLLNIDVAKRRLIKSISSGSTGHGIEVYRSKKTADIEKAFFSHYWGKYGFSFDKSRYIRIGQDALVSSEMPPTRKYGNRLMLSPVHIASNYRDVIHSDIESFKPEYIHGYPSCVYQLALLLEGMPYKKFKAILLASEPAYTHQLEKIQQVFSCPISVNYGLTERTNLAFADYENGEPLCFKFDDFYSFNEFIESPAGLEIVGTSYWNDVMPLLRYRTQDYCQKNGSDHFEIFGREQSFLIGKNGNKIPSLIVDDVQWDLISQIQIKQTQPGKLILYVVLKGSNNADEKLVQISRRQRHVWSSWFDVEVVCVDKIEKNISGKTTLVALKCGN